jgi:anti-sigma regulatory factor (Ser/Thr protein kinase)
MPVPDQFLRVGDFQAPQLVLNLEKIIPSNPKLLDDVVREITATLDRVTCWDDVETIGLAVEEALAKAIVHGNHCDPQKTVCISIVVNENCDLLVSVKDSGSGFDPSALPNPIATENLLAKHGRGIFLIRQLMDEVDFNFDHGTEVRMRRRQKWHG